jgi:hypothetical protein
MALSNTSFGSAASDPVAGTADAFRKLGDVMGRVVKDAVQPFAASVKLLGEAIKLTLGPVLNKIADAVKNTLVPAFKALSDKVADLAGRLGNLLAPVLDKVTHLVAPLAGSFGGVVAGLGKLAVGASAAVGGLVAFGRAVGGMVQLANPAAFARFQTTLNDLLATIGQGLAPVLEVVTRLVRMAGDTLATFANSLGGGLATVLDALTPVLTVVMDLFGRVGQAVGRIVEAMAPGLQAIGQAFGEILEAIQPVINLLIDLITGALGGAMRLLAEAVTAVVPYVIAFADAVGDMVETLMRWVRELLAFVGVELPEGGPGIEKGASVGKATRQAEITSVESVIAAAQKSAFSIGTGAGGDPAVRTASAAESLKAEAAAIRTQMNEIGRYVLELPRKLAEAIVSPETARKANEGLAGLREDLGLPALPRREGLGGFLKNVFDPTGLVGERLGGSDDAGPTSIDFIRRALAEQRERIARLGVGGGVVVAPDERR